MAKTEQKRLDSLDILRGLDLFMLVGLQPILMEIIRILDIPFLNNTLKVQLSHVGWEGFSSWDLVMPLFLFMSGATIPFSLTKYKNNNNTLKLWSRVVKRFFILFLLGLIVQGNLLGFNPNNIYLYSNTLQAIAVGYLLTIPIIFYFKPKTQLFIFIIILILYTLPMTLFGDWTKEENFAEQVDRMILGRFRDGASLNADGTCKFAPWYHYTWIWSSLTFCCTVTLGSFAGQIIKQSHQKNITATRKLLLAGILLTTTGYLWGLFQPIIKTIWTGSMTLFSGGICFILLALLYWWVDVKGHIRHLSWLRIYGCNAITAYVIGEVINFRSIGQSLFHGLAQYTGDWYPVLITTTNSSILLLILYLLYRNKIFLKV